MKKLKIIWIAFKAMWHTQIGDIVYYKNKKYYISNGARINSWRLTNLQNNDNGWVLRNECKKVKTLKNYIQTFKRIYHFYRSYWLQIWLQNNK